MGIAQKLRVDRLNLRPKLIASFVLVALLVAGTGLLGYQSVGELDHEAHLIAEDGNDVDRTMEMLVAVEKQQVAV